MTQTQKIKILYAIIFILLALIASFYSMRIIRRITASNQPAVSYYDIKVNIFNAMPRQTGQILFLGDSITDWCDFEELLPDMRIINRGIAGDTTSGVLRRLDEVISLRPSKLFLLIGTNDIANGAGIAEIAKNIRQIISRLHNGTPSTKIYVQSIFPTRYNASRPNTSIQELNAELKAIASETKCIYIDLYPLLLEDGMLGEKYTIDGLHLTGLAMSKWIEFVKPCLTE